MIKINKKYETIIDTFININLTNSIDNIGMLNIIEDDWVDNGIVNINIPYDVTYTGDTKINSFLRFGKTSTDSDAYNSIYNTGYTYDFITSNGDKRKLTGINENGFYTYKYYNDYKELNYSDLTNSLSEISYLSTGFDDNNTKRYPKIKDETLIGVEHIIKDIDDIYLDRGDNTSIDKHIKLNEIRSLNILTKYGNGYFKIMNA